MPRGQKIPLKELSGVERRSPARGRAPEELAVLCQSPSSTATVALSTASLYARAASPISSRRQLLKLRDSSSTVVTFINGIANVSLILPER
jgi:hypothetical protein